MIAPAYRPTETELKARARRAAFHASIEARAAELQQRRSAPSGMLVKPAPAEKPAVPTIAPPSMKEPWFSINSSTLVKPITVRDIQIAVCDRMGWTIAEFLSDRRTAALVHIRQIAMYLAKEFTTHSLPVLGRHFGGKDHTTVLHAVNKIKRECGLDPEHPEGIKRETVDMVKSLRDELEG